MRVLSALMTICRERIAAENWTQKEAAEILGVTQPRVSDLMRGRISVFSIDALVGFIGKLGGRLDLSYSALE
jgi:predicted XRE-type DNA-binding protein